MADREEIDYIVVVGLNRPRLNKIMALVKEKQEAFESPKVEFVFCLAAMQSYKADDGNQVRYIANFVYHDGSPMTKFLDDENFQLSLKLVLMVGYEWVPNDDDKIEKYFESFSLIVPVNCVKPHSEFDDLLQEMDFFKSLNDEEKAKHLAAESMGPTKMAKFIIDMAKSLRISKENNKVTTLEDTNASGQVEEKEEVEETPEDKQKKIQTINPNLPRFACRMCRTVLFGQDHLEKQHVQNLHSFKRANFDANRPTVACQSIFLNEEPLEWLSVNGQEIEGKLACPKCQYKLGHWRWAGAQCSCGTWVTPAIQIPSSKVDKMLPASEKSAMQRVVNPLHVVAQMEK